MIWYYGFVMPRMPKVTIELIPDNEQGGFTAHISGIPAYGEGATEKKAIADLKIGLQAFIEENGMKAALALVSSPPALHEVNFGDLVSHG